MIVSRPSSITSGDILGGRYRLTSRLGRGGMGEVWRAFDENLQSQVAVKLLLVPSSPEQFEEAKARFDIEQRTLAALRSPYVVRIHDRGLTEYGQPYFVMELLTGRSLHAHLEDHNRLGVLDTLEVLEDLGRAVHEPHLHGLAHRDIKPGNIFLTEYPGQRRLEVRLLDFGVAKSISSDAEAHSVTSAGMIVGTPLYVAPEQINGTPTLRSDIYSVGVVAYRCLAGVAPFRGEQHAVLRQHIGSPPPPLPAEIEAPTPLEALIQRMLEKSPEARPTAAELVSTVVHIRTTCFDASPPAGPIQDTDPTTPRSIFTSDPGLTPKARPALAPITANFEDSVVQEPAPPPRSRPVTIAALLLLAGAAALGGGALWLWPDRPDVTVTPLEAPAGGSAGASAAAPPPEAAGGSETTPPPKANTAESGLAPERASAAEAKSSAARIPPTEALAPPKPHRRRPRPPPRRRASSPSPGRGAMTETAVPPPAPSSPTPRTPPGGAGPAAATAAAGRSEGAQPALAPAKRKKTVRLGLQAPEGSRVLKVRINGKSQSSPPISIRLESGSTVDIEYVGADGMWRKKTIRVPDQPTVMTLD